MMRRAPRSTLFPCTTLFRSLGHMRRGERLLQKQAGAGVVRAGLAGFGLGDELIHGIAADQLIAQAKSCQTSSNNRSEEHTSELQSLTKLVCRLLLQKKKERNRVQVQPRPVVRTGPQLSREQGRTSQVPFRLPRPHSRHAYLLSAAPALHTSAHARPE